MNYIVAGLVLVLGMGIGMLIPDSDLRFGIAAHRSILTHSFLIPLICFWWTTRSRSWLMGKLAGIGLSTALAAHFCFDLFPVAWRGSALITIPLIGRTSPLFSWLWMATSIVICLYLAYTWLPSITSVSLGISASVLAFALLGQKSGWTVVAPLMAMIITSLSAIYLAALQRVDIRQLTSNWLLNIIKIVQHMTANQRSQP